MIENAKFLISNSDYYFKINFLINPRNETIEEMNKNFKEFLMQKRVLYFIKKIECKICNDMISRFLFTFHIQSCL